MGVRPILLDIVRLPSPKTPGMAELERLRGVYYESALASYFLIHKYSLLGQAEGNVGDTDDVRAINVMLPEMEGHLFDFLRAFFPEDDEKSPKIFFEAIVDATKSGMLRMGADTDFVDDASARALRLLDDDFETYGKGAGFTESALGVFAQSHIGDYDVRSEFIGIPVNPRKWGSRGWAWAFWIMFLMAAAFYVFTLRRAAFAKCDPRGPEQTLNTRWLDVTGRGVVGAVADFIGSKVGPTLSTGIAQTADAVVDVAATPGTCTDADLVTRYWAVVLFRSLVGAITITAGKAAGPIRNAFYGEGESETPNAHPPRRSHSPRRRRRANMAISCSICDSEARHVCSSCEQVAYCSSECQGKDWDQGHFSVCV